MAQTLYYVDDHRMTLAVLTITGDVGRQGATRIAKLTFLVGARVKWCGDILVRPISSWRGR